MIESTQQEAYEDLLPKNLNRRRIDRFGNPIDEDKEFIKTTLLPIFGLIEHSVEKTIEENDEEARKRALLEEYWRREDVGENFSTEETLERDDLETWRLNQL
jgi:hypothetical protein